MRWRSALDRLPRQGKLFPNAKHPSAPPSQHPMPWLRPPLSRILRQRPPRLRAVLSGVFSSNKGRTHHPSEGTRFNLTDALTFGSISTSRFAIPYPTWLAQNGPCAEVVISSRCRLARNLADTPFPW